MNYGKAIKVARNVRGFSQKELAKKVGLAPSYISKIEAGERMPTTETLEVISDAVEIPMYLMVLMASENKEMKGLPPKMVSKLGENLLNLVLASEKKHK